MAKDETREFLESLVKRVEALEKKAWELDDVVRKMAETYGTQTRFATAMLDFAKVMAYDRMGSPAWIEAARKLRLIIEPGGTQPPPPEGLRPGDETPGRL